ncbi:unnamed protein product [Adineta steineri]|uniref:G-protein coupled receptors family 1 profile domain-containing protein n=1 Tax=Adineta steineri TaxID=433720 RepID=A0A815MKP0_9BILA|nr:unnamed protein product [Adineta steineri]CAF4254654.1 unnamed protein product [Adineta steineri]
MSDEIFSNETDYDYDTDTTTCTSISTEITFYIFLLLEIPSVLCSLVLFYYFIRLREYLFRDHSNTTIIYLLLGTSLVTSIDMPIIIIHLQNCYYIESMKDPSAFCIFWILCDYTFYSLNLWLMAFACFERYLSIFFKQFIMRNRKRRFLLYYALVIFITLFPVLWYIYLILIYPCAQTDFDYTQITCDGSCYQAVDDPVTQNTDWFLADLLPTFLVIFFILVLILHVLYQRHKISRHSTQRNIWKRTRKMFLQLVPIAFIFLAFNMPLIMVGMLSITDPWYDTTPYYYANSFSYLLPLLMPFAVLSKQKEILKRLRILFKLRGANRIATLDGTV